MRLVAPVGLPFIHPYFVRALANAFLKPATVQILASRLLNYCGIFLRFFRAGPSEDFRYIQALLPFL